MTQSVSIEHVVRHAVPLAAHIRLPAHGDEAPVGHVPAPLHVLADVNVDPLHDAAAHCVPLDVYSQTPPAAHLPSKPQGGLAVHWPAGAVLPAMTLAQVPLAWPVSAAEHA